MKSLGAGAKNKVSFLTNNPFGYFISAMMAGMFVGFGVLLDFTIGGLLAGSPSTKIVMGVSFGIALSLVVIGGAELFTGNNLVVTLGWMEKTISIRDGLKLWLTCYFGNWLGSIVLALLFIGGGFSQGSVGEFIVNGTLGKIGIPFFPLLLRGVLCNILVCLAIWCASRCKSESGKLIMIFWCLFAFITTGYEHSVANMTVLTVGLLKPMGEAITIGGYLYNILTVTIGNMIGGIFFVALPYFWTSKRKDVA